MREGEDAVISDEERAEIEQSYRSDFGQEERWYDRCFPVIQRTVRARSLDADMSLDDYERSLQTADEVFTDVRCALNANREKSEPDWFQAFDREVVMGEVPQGLRGISSSPVDPSLLSDAAAKYLEKRWLGNSFLDWHIVNGFIFDQIARATDDLKSGVAIGEINWAYTLGGRSLLKGITYRAAIDLTKFILRWTLLPLTAGLLYYFAKANAALWVAGAYVIYLVFRLLTLPAHIRSARNRTRKLDEIEGSIDQLTRIFQTTRTEVIHPSMLKQKLLRWDEAGPFFLDPAVYAVLDRAIERDPSVLALPRT